MTNKRKRGSRNRRQERNRNLLIILLCILCLAVLIFLGWKLKSISREKETKAKAEAQASRMGESRVGAPDFDVQLLTPNAYSRPGIELEQVKGVVIHYTANPGSTAQNNRDYFENLKDSHETKVSSHFVIGLEGEIIQCIPSGEIAYASNSRNADTLSIECCHPDETGKFTDATYQAVVNMTAWLCVRFGLSSEDVIRHYDVTGKDCPKYFVENPEAWEQLKKDVGNRMEGVKEELAAAGEE